MVILKFNENLNQTIAVFKKIYNKIIVLNTINEKEFM